MLVSDFIVLHTAIWWKFSRFYLNFIATTLKRNIFDNRNVVKRNYLCCVLVHDKSFPCNDILWYHHWKSNIVRGWDQYCLSFFSLILSQTTFLKHIIECDRCNPSFSQPSPLYLWHSLWIFPWREMIRISGPKYDLISPAEIIYCRCFCAFFFWKHLHSTLK